MRILVLHSEYASGRASGENSVVEDEVGLLRDAGHEVRTWSAPPPLGTAETTRAGFSAIRSGRAVRMVKELCAEAVPHVVHFHNLFPGLSPAAITAAKKEGCAVVLSLHNYRLMCLPAILRRDGHLCEDCVGKVPWRGVVHRCYRGSTMASAALATSLTLHRAAGTFDKIDLFFAGSEFTRAKHLEAGFPADRMMVKPNFAPSRPVRKGAGRHFLFAGRLSPEKGVGLLLELWRREPPGRLVVLGDGPERDRLETNAPQGIEFYGTVDSAGVEAAMREARAVLVPSESYESSPRVPLEAFASGVPVISSNLGAAHEAITHDVSGLVVPPGDAGAWTNAIRQLCDDEVSIRLGAGALAAWESQYSPRRAIEALEEGYRRAVRHQDGTTTMRTEQ